MRRNSYRYGAGLNQEEIAWLRLSPAQRMLESAKLWWLKQGRVAGTLVQLCADYPALARRAASERPLLLEALKGNPKRVAALLKKEEAAERASDVKYWTPLKKELEELRLGRKKKKAGSGDLKAEGT